MNKYIKKYYQNILYKVAIKLRKKYFRRMKFNRDCDLAIYNNIVLEITPIGGGTRSLNYGYFLKKDRIENIIIRKKDNVQVIGINTTSKWDDSCVDKTSRKVKEIYEELIQRIKDLRAIR